MSTVYAKQYGRLGNNLFQRAAAIGYAVNNGIKYDIEPWHLMEQFNLRVQNIKEHGHGFQELPAPILKHVILDGYWQSEKYFVHCREEVLKAFGFNWMPVFPPTCAIHVRRGDYLKYPDKHPVVTETYLREAVEEMILRTDVGKFKFFSDDITWCFSIINKFQRDYPNRWWGYSDGRTESQDLENMCTCDHQIISNSTYSWWGAWLNQNPDKVVISPSKYNWFGPGNTHLCTDDIIPDSWIQIKY